MQSISHSTSTQNSTSRRSISPPSPQSEPQSPPNVFRCRPHLAAGDAQNEEFTPLPKSWIVSAAEVLKQMREAQTRDGFRFDDSLKRKMPDGQIDASIQRLNRLSPLEVLLKSDCFLEHEDMRPLLEQGTLPRGLVLAEQEWDRFCSAARADNAQLENLQFAERTTFLAKSAKEGVRHLQNCCAATAVNSSKNQDLETLVASCRDPIKAFANLLQDQIAQFRQTMSQPVTGNGLTRYWNTPTSPFDFGAKKESVATFIFDKLLLSFVRALMVAPSNELDQKIKVAKCIVAIKTCMDLGKKHNWV